MSQPEDTRMHWRKLLWSGGAALGAAATFNLLAKSTAGALENLLGGEEGSFTWRGWSISYTRRGEGPPVLLVHGIHAAAWSYEWRSNVDALARANTVYTIDLLGFGRSSRPPAKYSSRLYLALLSDFVAQVIGTPTALVATSLSAAYAIVLGARDPARFPALVLVGPTGLVRLNSSPSTTGEVARITVGAPIVGTTMFNTLVSRASIRTFLQRVYADDDLVTNEMVDAYYATAHQRGAKYAAAAFISGQLNVDVRTAVRRLAQPALLVWGEQAVEAPVEEVRGFRALKPDFELAILDPAGDLPHDEQPSEFNELVTDFLSTRMVATQR